MKLKPWQKLAILIAVALAGLAFSSWLFGEDLKSPRKFAARLEAMVGQLGPLAPAAFVGLQTVAPFLFLPAIPLAIAAGALFGPLWGPVWSLTGNVLGGVASFIAGRTFARDFVEKRATGKLLTVKSMIEAEGWRFVLFVRLVPMFPFGLINMTLGTTSIPLRTYTLMTLLGMAPGAFVYGWMGHVGRQAAGGAENTMRNFGIAVGAMLLLMGIPAAVRYARYQKDKKERERSAATPKRENPESSEQ